MRRRQVEEDEDNKERWMVSYADFITLLFAFFVVMYAISSVNQGKYEQLTSSLGTAFTGENTPQLNNPPDGNNEHANIKGLYGQPSFIRPLELARRNDKQRREREAMTAMANNLANHLAPMVLEGKIKVMQNNRGVRVDIHDSLLFAPGASELQPIASGPLNEIAQALKANNHAIQVEGHTDNVPIHNDKFYSNWELSAMRASSVVRMLQDSGLDEKRLSAVGFGASQPLEDNSTPLGRARNRRVSIMILYDSLMPNQTDVSEITPDKTTVIRPTAPPAPEASNAQEATATPAAAPAPASAKPPAAASSKPAAN
ncbi:flagellar motor protein MotD [Methylovorus sp. SPW-M1]